MNVNQDEPISAFAFYSQKSKRKRKSGSSDVNKLLNNLSTEFSKMNHKREDDFPHQSKKVLKNSSPTSINNNFGLNAPKRKKSFDITNGVKFKSKMNKKLKRQKKCGLDNNNVSELAQKSTLKHMNRNNVNAVKNRIKKDKIRVRKNEKKKLINSDINSPKSGTSMKGNVSTSKSESEDDENSEELDESLNNCNEDSVEDTELKVEPYSLSKEITELSEDLNTSSVDVASGLLEWMIKPVSLQTFMRKYWEITPLCVRRNFQNYFSALLSTTEIDLVLRNNNILFGKHIDVTSYSNGVRETHNQTGRAQPHVVWDYYHNGCSVRFLNPQAFVKKILTLNSTLQEYFGCFIGSNVYLTPPNSQGFAPHYDDIEAFVLQIEGKKQWKVYQPRNKHEYLDRFSSQNFSQDEIGEPILDVVLEAGDLLYFPRGFIHQASTVPGVHSLHITLSAYQRTAWIDLLEKVIPMALKRATHNSIAFRRGLPIGYLHSLGLGTKLSSKKKEKKEFIKTAKDLVTKLADHLDDLDKAVDQMGVAFMHDALPPVLTPGEKNGSVFGDGLHMIGNGVLSEHKVSPSKVKLLRANVCRLVEEEGEIRLYYSLDNSLEYHAEECQYLLLTQDTAFIIQYLIKKYPSFVSVDEIPYPQEKEDEKFQAVCDLWERGLLLTDEPLKQREDTES